MFLNSLNWWSGNLLAKKYFSSMTRTTIKTITTSAISKNLIIDKCKWHRPCSWLSCIWSRSSSCFFKVLLNCLSQMRVTNKQVPKHIVKMPNNSYCPELQGNTTPLKYSKFLQYNSYSFKKLSIWWYQKENKHLFIKGLVLG
jgi:hypothetical protein